MLSISSNIVVDRNSNRQGNVLGILGSDSIGNGLLHLRHLWHQMCVSASGPLAGGTKFKRSAYEPATPTATRPEFRLRQLTATIA